MWFLYIVIFVVVVAINGYLSSKAGAIAEMKGHSGREWFHICFWLGFPGYLLLIALPDLSVHNETDYDKKQPEQERPNTPSNVIYQKTIPVKKDLSPLFKSTVKEDGWNCTDCDAFNPVVAKVCCECGKPRR